MISITFVEQPESACIRHHHTVNHAQAAALPSVIGGPCSDFTLISERKRFSLDVCLSTNKPESVSIRCRIKL